MVYAHESTMYGAKSLVTIICDRTNELSALQGDLEILGEGQSPIEEVNLSGKHDGNQFYIWVALALAIGVVLIFHKRCYFTVNVYIRWNVIMSLY
ncbi:hypothetical protein M670_00666 [Schinkia azotoformans MEV2011]|uniref:Uncharacterized protein n=1 Tax=Schinkia azotoformans MEV2011 TaxID=1348973 RepID=A0A072P2F3_SCHAZ|nr:hypothetical protein [Schinkia azotoformans]KEF39645.1 hypothetical protein M670_00666 [Schinkia azotoformans MEV2011]MEC1695082.1 hypothetical protein [Schinkia azotoformans]MEC1718428.1 hypothetical protein [Schinkia azotoformans]MEC1726887.1 hypothetical protein [Schinkia azotoformans]MEC1743034.1 hypothetical protein [Schinkia azotoformans]